MTHSDRPAVKEPVPDWWFVGAVVVIFGAPMMLLFGAAFLRNPPAIVVLGGLFGLSTWWYFRRNRAAGDAHTLRPAAPSVPRPVAPIEPSVTTAPTPDTSTWVPWAVDEVRHTRAHPLRLESSLSKGAFLEALATRLPPLDTDLRFTTKIARPSSDRWMDVDDAGERARLSLHIDGFTFPRVAASAGVDGVIEGSPNGCSLDLWVRPSGLNRASNIVIGVMYAGLALVLLRAAVVSAMGGEVGGVLGGVAFAACFLGIGVATIRAQRRLTTRLVDELVTTVEEAADSTARTPPRESDLPPAPRKVMTSTEREVHNAATQVRIGQPSTSAGCLPTAAVMTSAVLLILGSIIILGS